MSYIKEILISKNRRLNLCVTDSEIANSGDLSDYSLNHINELVNKLSQVIANQLNTISWGFRYIKIDSYFDISNCFDEENNVILPNVSTQSLLNLMNEIKSFKTFYQVISNLKSIVGQAFVIVKSNPSLYKKYASSDNYFAVTVNDVCITLTLEESDFDLSQTEYTNQLKTIF